jgi:hypothetical protein
MDPNVERNEDKFTWGDMDITILRDYTKAKFGWSQNKFDEILSPVLKRIKERKSQKTVQDYFKRKVEFHSLEEHMSKRVKAAVEKLGPDNILELVDNNFIEEQLASENAYPIPSKRKKPNTKSKSKAAATKAKSSVRPGTSKNIMACKVDDPNVTVVSSILNSTSETDIIIPKTDRFQEIIPQREKDKQCLLQNKLKAIELFRKTTIDRKQKPTKKKVILPKEKAELSESSDTSD